MNKKLLFIQTRRRLLPLLQPTSRPSAICVPSSLSLSHTHAWLQRRFRFFLRAEFYLELLVSPSVIPLLLKLELSLTAAYFVSVEGASALQQVLESGFNEFENVLTLEPEFFARVSVITVSLPKASQEHLRLSVSSSSS